MPTLAVILPAPLRSPLARLKRRFIPPAHVRCDAPLTTLAGSIHSVSAPILVERGGSCPVMVRVQNLSTDPWSSRGTHPAQLRVRWCTNRKQPTDRREAVIPLPSTLNPGEAIDVRASIIASDAVGQFLLSIAPEQIGGPAFAGKPAWIDVQVVAPAAEEIDYYKVFATADLDRDYWTVVGPPTKEEFHRLSIVKRGQLIGQGLTPDSHVLDVGCGTGQLAAGLVEFLSDRGLYFGTDVGSEAIAFCQRKYPRPNFHFAVNEFTKLPVGDYRFDLACFFSVFTHTYPDETALLLAETARVLKPNGIIIGDVFTSPLTDRCAGNRGAVELNRDHFLRLVDLVGLKVEVVAHWAWKDHARREVLRFTKR